MRRELIIAIVLAAAAPLFAAEYHVNNVTGNDAFGGMSPVARGPAGPFATIATAVKKLRPGDTLHLAPTGQPYRESILVSDLQGTAESPITFDGHGAWLTGADPVSAAQWVPVADGPPGTLLLTGVELTEPWCAALCVDGEVLRAVRNQEALPPGAFYWQPPNTLYCNTPPAFGKATVVAGLPDGTTVALPPQEWGHTNFRQVPTLRRHRGLKEAPHWVKLNGQKAPLPKQPALAALAPGQCTNTGKTFAYRPPEGKAMADLKIMAIVRGNGVGLGGVNRHLVFQNLNAVYVGNDGYNIHGECTDVVFRNCNAFYAGDEGFSAHDRCETILDGGVFLSCGNGIHNVNNCATITRNVIVDEKGLRNDRQDMGSGLRRHEVTNTILLGGGLGTSESTLDNVLILGGGLQLGPDVSLTGVTAFGPRVLRVGEGSSVTLTRCFLAHPGGVIQARLDNPAQALVFQDCRYHPTTSMTWAGPEKRGKQRLEEWLAPAGGMPLEMDLKAALDAGTVPETIQPGMGCSRELLMRYIEFCGRRQALLDKALAVAWHEEPDREER